MRHSLRPAKSKDAAAIAAVIRERLDETVAADHITRCLSDGFRFTLVAESAGSVVGFVDNFVTVSATGERRMELDLLAVTPSARGQGLGKLLVAASINLARAHGISLIRALVKADNAAMQAVCQSLEMRQSPPVLLYARAPGECPADASAFDGHVAHLVPVRTLTYEGIWIEGALSRTAVAAALSMAHDAAWRTVGAVIPDDDLAARDMLEGKGFRAVGSYHWFTLMPGSG